MPKFKIIIHLIFLLSLLSCISCAKKTESPQELPSLIEAHEKFVKICREDYKLDITITPIENTLWIYVPLKKNFLDFKASKEGVILSKQFTEKQTINYLDGKFENDIFQLEYDISLLKSYPKSFGYSTSYSAEYQKSQQHVLTAIFRSYTEVKESSQVKPPEFFVIVAADIEKGIETQMIVAFQDLDRVMKDPSFHEEYARRAIIDYPTGNQSIIGDKVGKHLEIKALAWPEFLAKQIIYRVQFKYTRSAFSPSDDTRQELLNIIAAVTQAYHFKDFQSIQLVNLRDNSTYQTSYKELEKFFQPEPVPKGKLINIRFAP